MSFGRLGALGRGFGHLGSGGAAGSSVTLPTAPVLAMDPLWTSADSTPDFTIDIDDTIGAGDDVQLQIQASGGDWSVLLHDDTHTITAPEDAANEISLSNGALSNGNYEARARVNDGVSNSDWSNTQAFTIAAASVPVNSVAPVISGNTQVGQTLSTTDGTWSNSPTGYTYQWKRDGGDIGGATANTYVLVELDAGADITCTVTASNGSGSGSPATSNTLSIDITQVYQTNAVDASNLTTYTFSSQAFGTAASNRRIVVGVYGRQGGSTLSISSVTIGGVSASAVATQTSDTSHNLAALYIADVPTGTTGDVVVTWGVAIDRCGIGVWAIYGSGSATASDTDSANGTTDPSAVTLTVPAKGVAIAYGGSADGSTATWANITEKFDGSIEATIVHTGASIDSAAGGNLALSCDWSGTSSPRAVVFASWGP